MKIVSWNVNGLRSVMSKTFAEFLESVSPDVLCLQETKVSREVADSLEIPFKYKIFSCADKKGYSGTAIFSDIEPVSMRAVALDGHPEEGRITRRGVRKIQFGKRLCPQFAGRLEEAGISCEILGRRLFGFCEVAKKRGRLRRLECRADAYGRLRPERRARVRRIYRRGAGEL